jgi:hypothetical protein
MVRRTPLNLSVKFSNITFQIMTAWIIVAKLETYLLPLRVAIESNFITFSYFPFTISTL